MKTHLLMFLSLIFCLIEIKGQIELMPTSSILKNSDMSFTALPGYC